MVRGADRSVVAAVHELEQLHRELDVADAAVPALELAVVEALAGAASPRCAPSSHAPRAPRPGSSTSGHTNGSARSTNAAPSSRRRATGRALISACSSHVCAHRSQYAAYASSVRLSGPARPSGRRAASVRNTMPSALGSVITRNTGARRSLGLCAVAVVHEQHVDVARVVQLRAAELAHADHRHRERSEPRSRARLPGTPAPRPPARCRRPQVGDSEQIAARDADDLPVLPSAERRVRVVVREQRARLGQAVVERYGRAQHRVAQHRDRGLVALEHSEQRVRRDARPQRARSPAACWRELARRARDALRRAAPTPPGPSTGRRSSRAPGVRAPHPGRSSVECRAARSLSWAGDSPACGRRPDQHRRGGSRRQRGARARRPTSGRRRAVATSWCFPELTVTGYPPEDLLLKPAFVAAGRGDGRQARGAHRRVRRGDRLPRARGGDLYNAAAVCAHGEVARRVPQAAAAELLRVRRAALLHAVDRGGTELRHRGREGRGVDLRRRLGAGADPRDGCERRASSSSTSTRRPTSRAGCASARRCSRAQPRSRRSHRLRESRRRAGRARVRRRVARVRRAGPARRPRPSSSWKTCSSSTSTTASPPAGADRTRARRRCTRSTKRSCSAPATTCARTASTTC